MRARPLFWCLFVFSCLGVLVFAAIVDAHASALMRVRLLQQPSVSDTLTTLSVRLTDAEGFPH